MGTGEVAATLSDVPQGTRHRVLLVCPDGADGGSWLSLSEGGALKKGVWSDDCGWQAVLPPTAEDGEVTCVVKADGGGPFRFVVATDTTTR